VDSVPACRLAPAEAKDEAIGMRKKPTIAILSLFLGLSLCVPQAAAQARDLQYFLPSAEGPLAISPFAADGVSGATQAAPSAGGGTFLGFPDKASFHRFSGWMSGGLLLAAGIVGGIHILDMMTESHAGRGGLDDFDPATCGPILQGIYHSDTEQALRWIHVGLLAGGEVFYLANAVTGVGFMGELPPGWSARKIHRYAFYAHCALMVSEAVVGFFLSDALARSDHEAIQVLGATHAAIGIAIPVVIISAGAIMGR